MPGPPTWAMPGIPPDPASRVWTLMQRTLHAACELDGIVHTDNYVHDLVAKLAMRLATVPLQAESVSDGDMADSSSSRTTETTQMLWELLDTATERAAFSDARRKFLCAS